MSKRALRTIRAKPGPAPAVSVVERTAAAIACDIASGKYRAGAHLPSVRQLAEDFGINPNSVQAALARLQASGFIHAQPRSGLVVRDLELYGGIATWRYIFQFAQRLPERAAKICGDLLEMRLTLLTQALNKIAAAPRRYDPTPVRRAVERLELAVAEPAADLAEIARAELHAIRMLVLATGQSVVTAVLNSISEVYLDVPAMIAAMYVQPTDHVELWTDTLKRWERGEFSERNVAQLQALLGENDRQVVERFRASLSRQPVRAPSRRAAH